MGFPGGSDTKESACSGADLGSIPGWGRFSGGGNDYPLQYPCLLENSMDREAWQAAIHGVADSDTTQRLTHTPHTHTQRIEWGSEDEETLLVYLSGHSLSYGCAVQKWHLTCLLFDSFKIQMEKVCVPTL